MKAHNADNASTRGRFAGIEAEGLAGPNPRLAAADKLHQYLLRTHWSTDGTLIGPDPGIRFNARMGRFVKSYTGFLPWSDNLTYMQAQGYWILDNWLLHDLHDGDRHQDIALRTSESVLALQRSNGSWAYPNPEWKGRVATVEGCFASLGLLESYARSGRQEFLEGAIRWHRFMRENVGFRRQTEPEMLAVNYFAHSSGDRGGVPNNSTLALWTAARLCQLTDNESFMVECGPMLQWLAHVQLPGGELPYEVGSDSGEGRVHFLCFQYNAFEFMDLVHYHRITGDRAALQIMEKLSGYLVSGLQAGIGRYECSRSDPEVLYYSVAVAQALSQAADLGLVDDQHSVHAAYDRLLSVQLPGGNFGFHSQRNYRVLSDRRSYPRYLSMILHHLLLEGRRELGGTS